MKKKPEPVKVQSLASGIYFFLITDTDENVVLDGSGASGSTIRSINSKPCARTG